MSQVVALRCCTKTWCASFFYNSRRTWFIKLIEEEGKENPLGFYWQRKNLQSTHLLVRITLMHMILWGKEKFLLRGKVYRCIFMSIYLL